MKIFQNLRTGLSVGQEIPVSHIVSPESGSSQLSMVIGLVEPSGQFPNHTHANSEDCIILLSGSGDLVSDDKRHAVDTNEAVLVSEGCDHGFEVRGSSTMLEIGFQVPPDPARHPEYKEFDAGTKGETRESDGIQVRSIIPKSKGLPLETIYNANTGAKHVTLRSGYLQKSEEFTLEEPNESIVIVIDGEVECDKDVKIAALGAVFFDAEEHCPIVGVSDCSHIVEVTSLSGGTLRK